MDQETGIPVARPLGTLRISGLRTGFHGGLPGMQPAREFPANMIKVAAAFVTGLSLLLIACGQDDQPSGTSDPEVKGGKVPADVAALIAKVDDSCAANGTGYGSATLFDVKTFDASKVMREIKAEDKDKMGSDCSEDRIYSMSREDGVKMFREHINDELEATKQCLATELTAAERTMLEDLVSDPTNLAVFSNAFGGGESEACGYYEFDVYRGDGVKLHIVFNYTS